MGCRPGLGRFFFEKNTLATTYKVLKRGILVLEKKDGQEANCCAIKAAANP